MAAHTGYAGSSAADTDHPPYAGYRVAIWFQGFGTTNPKCKQSAGDKVGTGWLGASAAFFRNGSLVCTSAASYNSSAQKHWSVSAICSSVSGDYQTWGTHYWYALDAGVYASDQHFSPIIQL
jgi:hypothetical protein